MKQVTWQQVILILGLALMLLTTVVILSNANKDVSSILAAVLAVMLSVMGVFGVDRANRIDHKMDQVRELSNGRLTEAMQMFKESQQLVNDLHTQVTALALQVPMSLESDKK